MLLVREGEVFSWPAGGRMAYSALLLNQGALNR